MASRPVEWLGDVEAKPAPEPLRRIQALINTIDRESDQDRLAQSGDAEPWLLTNDLLARGATLREDDRRTVIAVREALRALVVQNSGGPAPGAAALAPLRAIAGDGLAQAAVDDDGTVRLNPAGDSVRSRLLSLLLIVKDAQLDATWAHLKACANDECQWVFYDRSRNHGGTWCDMATCGNKLKNRDFRARNRESR